MGPRVNFCPFLYLTSARFYKQYFFPIVCDELLHKQIKPSFSLPGPSTPGQILSTNSVRCCESSRKWFVKLVSFPPPHPHTCLWAQNNLYLLAIEIRYRMEGSGFEPWWERFSPLHIRPDQPLCPHNPLYSGYRVSTHHHLAPRLKKVYSYTSISPLGLWGDL